MLEFYTENFLYNFKFLDCDNLINTGDFNINSKRRYIQQFQVKLNANNVTQVINEPFRVM